MLGLGLERVVVNGQKMYKVVRIHALHKKDLPDAYLRGFPHAYQWCSELIIRHTLHTFTKIANCSYISPDELHNLRNLLNHCGNRLMRINKKLKQQQDAWHGRCSMKV